MNKKYLPLLYILVLASFLSFFNYRGIDFSDEYNYARNAWKLSEGTFELSPSVFNNRFGILIPMAGFVKLLGAKPFVFTIWSFIAFLILLISNFYFIRKFDEKIAVLSTLFLAFNPILLELSADVSQDIVMTAFATISIFILWRVQALPNHFSYKSGVLFSVFLFISFATKIGVFYISPFILFWLISDFLKKQNQKFWTGAFLTGGVLLAAYFYAYYHFTGNPFYRINAIEGEFNVYYESYGARPEWEFWARLTVFPIPFLLKSYGIGVFVMLAGLWMFEFLKIFKKQDNRPDSPTDESVGSEQPLTHRFIGGKTSRHSFLPNFLFLYFLFLLFIHWFGTTSLKYYNPLIFSERMWLLLVPPIVILSVFSITKVLPELKGKFKTWAFGYFGLIIGLCAVGLYLAQDRYPWFVLPLTVSVLIVFWFWFRTSSEGNLSENSSSDGKSLDERHVFHQVTSRYPMNSAKKRKLFILILFPFIIVQLNTVFEYKKNTPFFYQKDFLETLSENENHLIYTDRNLPHMYDIYFEFNPPENIIYRQWETADSSDLSDFGKFYVVYDQKKKLWLEDFLKIKVPDFVKDDSVGSQIMLNEYLKIKEISSSEMKKIRRFEE